MRRAWILGILVALVPAAVAAGEHEDLAGEAWVVLEKATRSGDMLARARAITALMQVPGHDGSAYVREALKDPQWIVRKAGLKVLVAKGDAEAREGVAIALRDATVPLDQDAFDLVSTLKPADARAMIVSALLDNTNVARDKLMTAVLAQDRATQAAVLAAGLAKGEPLFTTRLADVRREDRGSLVEALLKERDAKVQAAALRFANEKDVPVPASSLKPMLKASDPEVRYAAAEMLAKGGDATAVPVLLPLADGDLEAQARFLKSAAAAPSAALLPRLRKMLEADPPQDVLVPLYQALAGTGDDEIGKRIQADVNATVLPRRAAAARALGRLLGTRAIPKLNQLLVDGSPVIRGLAATALGDLGQAESVEVLERALRDTERDVRLAVVRALAKIHDKSVVGVASFVVYDSDPEIRKTAILAVCNVNHESALPILRINVEDPDPEIRYNALRAMIYLDPKTAMELFDRAISGLRGDDLVSLTETFKDTFLPFLKKAVVSERAWARQGALRAVALLPAVEAPFLKEVASLNPYPDARRDALGRLEARSCADALEVAEAVLKDKDPDVRIAGVEALVRCGDNGSLVLVKATIVEDREENVRVAAAIGLLSYPKTGAKKAPPPAKGGKPK